MPEQSTKKLSVKDIVKAISEDPILRRDVTEFVIQELKNDTSLLDNLFDDYLKEKVESYLKHTEKLVGKYTKQISSQIAEAVLNEAESNITYAERLAKILKQYL